MPELATLADVLAKAVEPYDHSQPPVLSRIVATPPFTPAVGDRYLVPIGALGAWATRDNSIAEWTGSLWLFLAPAAGVSTWIIDEEAECHYNGSQWVTTAGGGAGAGGALVHANKRMPARTTTADGQVACDIALLVTPVGSVTVLVNGVAISELGNGTKNNCACWFTGDGGVTAKAYGQFAAGDVLMWNGSIAGYELDVGDTIDFMYESA